MVTLGLSHLPTSVFMLLLFLTLIYAFRHSRHFAVFLAIMAVAAASLRVVADLWQLPEVDLSAAHSVPDWRCTATRALVGAPRGLEDATSDGAQAEPQDRKKRNRWFTSSACPRCSQRWNIRWISLPEPR